MCLSQPSPTSVGGSSAATVGGNQQQHSLISAGLLQRAIQEAQHSPTPNSSALSGLALALASGKCPSTTSTPKANAASILEHGEQKASQNEASADSLTSPTTIINSSTARSLQDLLTSPRTRHGHHYGAGASPSTTTAACPAAGSAQTNQNNANCYNSVVVMGGSAGSNSSCSGYRLDTASGSRKSLNASSNTAPNSTTNTPSPLPVTTTPTPISTFPTGAKSLVHSLGTGRSSSTSNSHSHSNSNNNSNSNSNSNSTSNLTDTHPHNPLIAGDGIYLATGITHAMHSTNLKSTPASSMLSSSSPSSSLSASASSSSASQASAASSPHSSPPSSSSYMPQAMIGPTTRLHSPGSPGLLTMNDADRRDPSPYRCGHCHQVSNWKHVIQVFV